MQARALDTRGRVCLCVRWHTAGAGCRGIFTHAPDARRGTQQAMRTRRRGVAPVEEAVELQIEGIRPPYPERHYLVYIAEGG